MIQVVTYTGKEQKYKGAEVEQYSLHDIRSLDEYEITVINLNDVALWKYNGKTNSSINTIEDLISISEMISRCKLSKLVLIFPQNLVYEYYHNTSGLYHLKKEIKNMLPEVTVSILSKLFQPISNIQLVYENTKTEIGNSECEASFCFVEQDEVMLSSMKSGKATAIKKGKVVLTTLLLPDYTSLIAFLNEVHLLEKKNEIPAWLNEVCMFDDTEQKDVIKQCNENIRIAENQIETAKNVLSANDRLKSVLYTNGDELVEVVFDILEEMLECDLSSFVDEKKEDFLFDLEGFTFIGEIKGVNHNVKNQNVTQLDVHYQGYLDEHEDADKDKLKALLIINHQKNKPLFDREPVKDTQIQLAKRNGSLIVDTYTLLRLLEKCRRGSLSREEILNMLKKTIGYLVLD